MRRIAISALAFLALVSCGEMHTGGAGQLSDGRPISGTVTRDLSKNLYTFTILSPDGWQCSGTKGPSAQPTAVVSIPLECTNGATGNMLLTMNQYADEAVATFSLSNGRTGSVKFGGR